MTDDACDLLCLDLPRAEAMRAALPAEEALENAAGCFKASPTRRG